jgi:peptidoglycan/LPS O-acetylase OafA/YrhL
MVKPTQTTQFYRPELDGLRFFAFLLVFLQHLPVPDGYTSPRTFGGFLFDLRLHGWMGVDLFLCLSSFLVAKLLLLEWQANGFVSIKNFYIRRVFRIWPLYFWVCLLGFLIFPLLGWFGVSWMGADHLTLLKTYLWPYLLLVGNWATTIYGYPPFNFLAPLWTISLEEQFYLVGPILLVLVRFEKKAVLKLSGLLLFLTFAARIGALVMGTRFPTIWVCTLTRLDPFVLGTCLAIFEDELILFAKKFSPVGIGLAGVALLLNVVILFDVEQRTTSVIWQYFLMDLGFCCLIFSMTRLDSLKKFFSKVFFTRLGKISYGLYVYHILAFRLTMPLMLLIIRKAAFRFDLASSEVIVFSMGLAMTVIISFLSYQVLEKTFLKLKVRFTAIESRPI